MKKYIITILLLVATMLSLGATATDYKKYIPIMTPESATLGQYGAFPVSLYTGSVDISIPIHTLKTNNITIPISLQYNGTGLIPNKECGKVGHDWALVAGGAITRTVNGVPDEWQSSGSSYDYGQNGMLYYQKSGNTPKSNAGIRFLEIQDNANETTPDMFSFNFCGHTGQFMIDHDGNVKVVGKAPYKVDISDIKIQQYGAVQQISSIIITAGDGTRYTFGGNIHALEISYKKQPSPTASPFLCGVITAFHLTQIETVNGETVDFIYCDESSDNNILDVHSGFKANRYTVKIPFYSDFYENVGTFISWEYVEGAGAQAVSLSYTKGVYLHEIVSSKGERIVFEYKDREHRFTNVMENEDRMKDWNNIINPRLERIRAFSSTGEMIMYATMHQSFQQSYRYSTSIPAQLDSYRMFLDSVVVNRDKYSFGYYKLTGYPEPHTRGIDLQGYYNGNDENATLLGVTKPTDTQDFSHREPSFLDARNGMLKTITYPTGGTTTFTYENHNYGKAVVIDPLIPELRTANRSGLTGGVRIKSIANSTGDTVSYEYLDEYAKSSGVINDVARYSFNMNPDPGGSWNVTALAVMSGNNLLAGNSVSEPHIGYSRVVERRGEGNGYKVYYYTTFDDYKDEPVVDADSRTYSYSTNISVEQVIATLRHTSMHLDRGKLVRLEEYDNEDNLLRKTEYTYNDNEDRKTDAIYSSGRRLRVNNYYVANSVAHYYYPKHVVSQTTEEYLNSTWHSTTTCYTYNEHNQLVSEETVINSNEEVNSKKTFYPKDFTTNTLLSAMADSNMLNAIVREEYYCNGILTHSTENEFAGYSGLDGNTTYYDICAVKESASDTSFYPLRIHGRDKNRNIESMTVFGKPVTSFLWGYDGLYPIAVFENVTMEQLDSMTQPLKQPLLETSAPIVQYEEALGQIAASMPDALVTLYDYKPQVGIKYCKEPNGLKHYYSYDTLGRLVSTAVEDKAQKVNRYSYNTVHNSKLMACWKDAVSNVFLGSNTLTCHASGGAKDYSYNLTLKKGNIVLSSTTSDKITYNFTTEGTYTFSGTVTDSTTNETASFANTFTVIEPQVIEFTNIEDHVTVDHGCYSSTAIIECESPITVTFSVMCEVNSNAANTTYGCSIGGYTLTQSSQWPEKTFTVELEAGENIIELYINDLVGTASIELIIEGVEDANAAVGENSYLHLSTDKTN